MPQPRVSIIIPTMRRTLGLSRVLFSLRAQIRVSPEDAEIIVVDNDPAGSAMPMEAAQRAAAVFPVRFIHMPEPGVANARNAGLAIARGAWIAFLDDDEEATPRWLATLMADAEALDADVVFGAIQARLPASAQSHADYFARFFGRQGPAVRQVLEKPYGCGNSLIRKSAMPMPAFCATRNELGGEDDELFAQMKAKGAVFGWSPGALALEHPATHRITLGYTLARAFQYGQAPVIQAARGLPDQLHSIAIWMMIGLAQGGVHMLIASACWALRRGNALAHLDRMAQGFGKFLWFPPFQRGFYGRIALRSAQARLENSRLNELATGNRQVAH